MRFPSILAVKLLGLLALSAAALAAEPPPAPQTAREGMPVMLANRQIIILRGPIAGYTARERAAAATQRIDEALAAEYLPAATTEEAEEGTRVLLGGRHVFLVTRVDIDTQAGETTPIVARAAVKRLEQALAERRQQETPRYLAEAAVFAALATLLYGTLLWAIFRVNRWVGRRLTQSAATHSRKLQLLGLRVIDATQVLRVVRRVFTFAAWAVAVVLASAWLSFVLERFPYTRPWGEQLGHRLLDIAKDTALGIVGALPGLAFAIIIFLIARAIVRTAATVFDRIERGEREVAWIDADTAKPTRRIFNFIIWAFALALAYPHLPGAETEAFKGLSVLVGLMVSLGASSVVGQAFNGFILMYTRVYRSGDYVRIGDNEGTVESLNTFVTRIRTGLGDELTLPNSSVMATSIRNYSRAAPGAACVLDVAVTIGYSAPWRQVHAMLEEAAQRTEGVSPSPPPYVRQTALADFCAEYRLVAQTPVEDPEKRAEVLSRLHGNIQDVFNEHGVQIMSPHYMTDPKEPQLVPKERWYAPPAKTPERKKDA
jgi:small-conductance mechanosensitive channel